MRITSLDLSCTRSSFIIFININEVRNVHQYLVKVFCLLPP